MSRGRIFRALSGFYDVKDGEQMIRCRARGRFRKDGQSPLVGDWVTYTPLEEGVGILESIEPRRNAFQRPTVANIDQLVLVVSEAIPKTDPFLIDRMSAIATLKHCDVLVCINKCDLEPAETLRAIYQKAGLPTVCVSAKTGEGMEELLQQIRGKLSAFTGNSGVGKSSLLNALDPAFALATGEVSKALGRGKHTTRHVELFTVQGQAEVIDTPGFSSFESEEMDYALKQNLPELFPEFLPYLGDCRFVGCSHTKEKGCAIRSAREEGQFAESRYQSYLRLFEEFKSLKEWQVNR